MKRLMILIPSLSLLVLLAVAPLTAELTQGQEVPVEASPQVIRATSLSFMLSTTSDWTRTKLQGLNLLNCSYNFITGEDAPQLVYDINWNEMYVSKKSYDETAQWL